MFAYWFLSFYSVLGCSSTDTHAGRALSVEDSSGNYLKLEFGALTSHASAHLTDLTENSLVTCPTGEECFIVLSKIGRLVSTAELAKLDLEFRKTPQLEWITVQALPGGTLRVRSKSEHTTRITAFVGISLPPVGTGSRRKMDTCCDRFRGRLGRSRMDVVHLTRCTWTFDSKGVVMEHKEPGDHCF